MVFSYYFCNEWTQVISLSPTPPLIPKSDHPPLQWNIWRGPLQEVYQWTKALFECPFFMQFPTFFCLGKSALLHWGTFHTISPVKSCSLPSFLQHRNLCWSLVSFVSGMATLDDALQKLSRSCSRFSCVIFTLVWYISNSIKKHSHVLIGSTLVLPQVLADITEETCTSSARIADTIAIIEGFSSHYLIQTILQFICLVTKYYSSNSTKFQIQWYKHSVKLSICWSKEGYNSKTDIITRKLKGKI